MNGSSGEITRADLPDERPEDSHDLVRLSEREVAALRKFKTPNEVTVRD